MTRGRSPIQRWNYDWEHAECELASGVLPAVVALRMGKSEDEVILMAEIRNWLVSADTEGRAP